MVSLLSFCFSKYILWSLRTKILGTACLFTGMAGCLHIVVMVISIVFHVIVISAELNYLKRCSGSVVGFMVAGHTSEFVNRELETVAKQMSGGITRVGQSDGEG